MIFAPGSEAGGDQLRGCAIESLAMVADFREQPRLRLRRA